MNLSEIRKHDDRTIFMEWRGERGVERYALSYAELRFECPCAGCVDEMTGVRTLRREAVSPEVRPIAVEAVGRYALKIEWNDKHSTGMYSYDRLHELCVEKGQRLA